MEQEHFTVASARTTEMADFDRTEKAARYVSKQLLALEDIVNETKSTGDTELGFEQLRRWKQLTIELLNETVGLSEATALENKKLGSFIMGQPLRNFLAEAGLYDAFLVALNQAIQDHPERILREKAQPHDISAVAVPSPSASRTVFLIHGHDELNLLRLCQLLKDRWDIQSIILKERAGKGRTLIEKFEGEAPAATFAIALLSPDDQVQGAGANYPQARPNVVFELGWFYGRLGREKVCILLRKGTKIHSDLDGISRIEFNDSLDEVSEDIGRELKAAGLI
jgi:predicted nucleotide-binding protein